MRVASASEGLEMGFHDCRTSTPVPRTPVRRRGTRRIQVPSSQRRLESESRSSGAKYSPPLGDPRHLSASLGPRAFQPVKGPGLPRVKGGDILPRPLFVERPKWGQTTLLLDYIIRNSDTARSTRTLTHCAQVSGGGAQAGLVAVLGSSEPPGSHPGRALVVEPTPPRLLPLLRRPWRDAPLRPSEAFGPHPPRVAPKSPASPVPVLSNVRVFEGVRKRADGEKKD